MFNFQLVPFSTHHISDSLVIFNQEFGQGYFDFNQMKSISSHKNFFGYSIVNQDRGRVVGICIGYHSFLPEANFTLPLNKKYVYLKSIAINSEYQGKGLGKLLLDKFIASADVLKQAIYTTVWVKEENTSVFEKMLLKSDFMMHSEYQNFWKEKSVIEKFECKKCGNPPCTCTMRVYLKK